MDFLNDLQVDELTSTFDEEAEREFWENYWDIYYTNIASRNI